MDILRDLIAFLIALIILISAHEYGHFYVARRLGVKVLRFSFGFGKVLWSKIGKDGTEYSVSLIPLGGYVKMLDERAEEVPDELKSQAFNNQSVYKRIAIVAAGPIANFILAILVLYVMYLIGSPTVKPVVTDTISGTPASYIKLQEPMRITSIGTKNVHTWEDINLVLATYIGEKNVAITLSKISDPKVGDKTRDENVLYNLDLTSWKFDPEKDFPIISLGFNPYSPKIEPVISRVVDNGAASKAGLKAGDRIIKINNKEKVSWEEIVSVIRSSPEKSIHLKVMRNQNEIDLSIVPDMKAIDKDKKIGYIGVLPTMDEYPSQYKLDERYGVFEAFPVACYKTWQLVEVSFKMLVKLISGDIPLKNLSGPISIAQGAGNSASYGFVVFLGFLALISVNLGIINLFPLPILDGGHLVFFFYEMIFKKPVPEKVQELGFKLGMILLFIVMGIAIFHDITRL